MTKTPNTTIEISVPTGKYQSVNIERTIPNTRAQVPFAEKRPDEHKPRQTEQDEHRSEFENIDTSQRDHRRPRSGFLRTHVLAIRNYVDPVDQHPKTLYRRECDNEVLHLSERSIHLPAARARLIHSNASKIPTTPITSWVDCNPSPTNKCSNVRINESKPNNPAAAART